MKKIYYMATLLLSVIFASSQTVIIKDKITMQPLIGASMKVKGMNKVLLANNSGIIDMTEIINNDTFQINAFGYQEQVLTQADLKRNKFIVELSELPYGIDEIVVSASRFEEKKSDVPQQILVIKSKELEFMNQQTTADVLQSSGSVFVQKSQGGGGSPVLRGFEANKVLIVIDGIRMNNAIFRAGHLQNVISLDNSVLDKMEIVYGPGSVVYGSDALGGVMHFYTKRPLLGTGNGINFKANAFTRYSSATNEKTFHSDLNFGFKKIAFLSSITYSDFGDMMQGKSRNPFYGSWGKREYYADRINNKDTMMANSNDALQRQSGYSQVDLMQKILVKQGAHINHLINLQYSTTSNINRYDRLTEFSGSILKYAQWYYGPQQRLLAAYTLNIDTKNILFDKANIIAGYQNIEESRHDRKFNKSNLSHRTEKVNVYTINADFEKETGRNELRFGVEYTFNDVNSSARQEDILSGLTTPLDTRYPDGGSTMQTIAAYATHSREFSEKMVLSDGLRVSNIQLRSKFNDTSFFPFPFNSVSQNSTAINGNIGLTFMPGHNWRFSILGSTGFRAPNVDDATKVFDSKPGNVVVPNPDLKPEYTYNTEITVGKVFYEKIKIEGTLYYSLYKDALTLKRSVFNNNDSIFYSGVKSAVSTTVNAAEAYLYGYYFGLVADITDAFSITSTINYTFGRIKTDTIDYPLDHIPPVYGKTGFCLKVKKFRGEFFALYQGWKKASDYNLGGEDNEIYASAFGTPAWYTLNIRTAYYVSKNFQLQMAVDNILDEYYRVFASGISAPGRNLSITLRGAF